MPDMSVSPTIRRAVPADFALAREAIAELHGRAAVDEAALAAFLADTACYLILAIEGGRVIGSLNGHALRHPHRAAPQFLLYEIDVRPEWRRQGIGRSLVTAFSAAGRAAGACEVWVVTNESTPAAMGLYHACGYRRINADDVMLELSL